MTDFFVGQKVVCVDARPVPEWTPWQITKGSTLDGLTLNTIYTVADTPLEHGVPTLVLQEITRATWPCSFPCLGFNRKRFRPLESKSIELFRAIAADPGKFNFTPSKRERERVRT